MKKIIKLIFSIISISLISGCVASVNQSYSPSGKASYKISCNNTTGSLTDCYQKAGEICKTNGYNIVSSHHDAPFANLIAECKD